MHTTLIVSEQQALPDNDSHNNTNTPGTSVEGKLPLQIRHKIALSFALLLLFVTAAFWLLFQNELNRSLQEYRDILGASLAQQTAASVRELVLVNDQLGLNVVLTQLVRNDIILNASVHDVDQNQLSSVGQPNVSVDPRDIYTADINVQEAIAGSVSIRINTQAVGAYQARMRNLFLLVLAVSLVLSVTTAFALAGHITSPLRSLLNMIAENTSDDDEEPAPDLDETGRLQYMTGNLLLRYQDMEARLLETGVWQGDRHGGADEPARMPASVLAIKVVNIHTAIEVLHPATLSALLQEYLFYLKQAARLYGGEFQRVNGESVAVCFDEDTCDDNHPVNALYCAGLFQSLMARINNRHRKKGEQNLEFRMAIHSGDIFKATGIDNTAEEDKTTILGKTLDIVYFLSKQGAPGELVISESTCSQARQFEEFEPDRQREVSMPADNVSFMAYILGNGFAEDMGMIRKQRRHILGTDKQEA